MLDAGFDIEADEENPLEHVISKEENAERKKLFKLLTDEQRELLEIVFIDGKTMAEIARDENVEDSAIWHRLGRIIKKIKENF